MRGETVIEFAFPFRYSEDGVFSEANSITVRAPGLSRFDVHTTMQAYVARAILGMAPTLKAITADGDETTDDDKKKTAKKDMKSTELLAMGLGIETFPKCVAWLRKTLTGAKALAFVSGTEQPITDEIWEGIEAEGGMDAVMEVLATFVDFFFIALGGPPDGKTGNTSSRASSSATKAASPTNARTSSRSKS